MGTAVLRGEARRVINKSRLKRLGAMSEDELKAIFLQFDTSKVAPSPLRPLRPLAPSRRLLRLLRLLRAPVQAPLPPRPVLRHQDGCLDATELKVALRVAIGADQLG